MSIAQKFTILIFKKKSFLAFVYKALLVTVDLDMRLKGFGENYDGVDKLLIKRKAIATTLKEDIRCFFFSVLVHRNNEKFFVYPVFVEKFNKNGIEKVYGNKVLEKNLYYG